MSIEGIRVLIIDDEAVLLKMFARMLRRQEVAMAGTAIEALQVLRERDFDIVISDMNLPGMSGLQLIEEMKKLGKDIPVILISGDGTIEENTNRAEAGVASCLTKPFTSKRLKEEIEIAINEHGRLQMAS